MRKAKRLIALLTVAMFVLSFAAPAGAATFSDVKGSASDEIYRLNALGIISGYPDGSFKPDNNITRAEFAVIAMSAAGMKNAADGLKSTASKFKDVKAGEWYTGWVNLAASMGYIAGYPDGTFKPNANISYAECITILVRLLGYTEKLPGTWPTEYLVKAADLGITDDVTFASSALATRSNIAVLTSNTLDQNMVVWSKDIDDWLFKVDADDNIITLLSDKFDGAVYDEEDYKVTAWEVDSDGAYVVTLDGDPLGDGTTEFTLADNVVIENGTPVPYLGSHLVNFIYNSDDEEISYIDVVSTKIKSDDVDDDGAKLKINGTAYKFADGVALADITNSAGATIGYADEAAGVNNDWYDVWLNGDNKIYKAVKVTASAPKVVDELKSDKTLKYDGGSVDLDQDDIVVLKDGQVADVEDLKQNDYVYITEDANGLDVFVDAFTMKATGKFEAAKNTTGDTAFDQVKIAGKFYDVNSNLKISTDDGDTWDAITTAITFFDDLYNEDVNFALDKKGDVAFIMTAEKADSSAIYAVVNDAETTTKGLVTAVSVMTSTGSEVTYDVNTTEVQLDYSGDSIDYTKTDEDAIFGDNDFVKLSLDANGDVDDLDLLTTLKNLTDASEDLNKIYFDGKWYYTTSDTKVINANAGDDAETVAVKDLLDYVENTAAVNNAYVELDGSDVEFILFNNAAVEAAADDMAMMIDFYYSDSKYYATVDIRGTVDTFELNEDDDYDYITEDVMYEYSMNGTKVDFAVYEGAEDTTAEFDATVEFDVYGEITGINEANKSIEISDTLGNLSVDDDSYIYDMTGSDPAYIDFEDLSEGDYVFIIKAYDKASGLLDADRKGIADIVLVVDDEDYPACEFETGDTGSGPDL